MLEKKKTTWPTGLTKVSHIEVYIEGLLFHSIILHLVANYKKGIN